MTHFGSCLAVNGLDAMLEAEFSRWGKFTAEAADIVLEVSKLEKITPELLAYTWVKESCFTLRPLPNTNSQPGNPYAWDIGPGQLNMGWVYKSAWVGEYSVKDLHYDQVFGRMFYMELAASPGVHFPCAFTGDHLANLRMAARRLLARKGDDEEKATLYPGPKSQDNRRAGWKKYGKLMQEFFKSYGGANA